MTNKADIITTLRVDGDEIDGKLTEPAKRAQKGLEQMTDAARKSNPALSALSEAAGGFGDALQDIPILGTVIRKLGPAGIAASVGITAALGAVKGLMEISESARDRIREISTGADALSIGTNLFQVLERDATLANISIGTVEQGIRSFRGKLDDLSDGKGNLSEALSPASAEAITSAETFEQKLVALSAALKNARSETDFINIATAAFGENGVKVAKLLKETASNLSVLEDRYSSLAGVIDEAQIAQIKRNDETIEGLKKASEEAGTKISANLEPIGSAIEINILNKLVLAKAAFVELSGIFRGPTLESVGSNLDKARSRLERLQEKISTAPPGGYFQNLQRQINLTRKNIEELEADQARLQIPQNRKNSTVKLDQTGTALSRLEEFDTNTRADLEAQAEEDKKAADKAAAEAARLRRSEQAKLNAEIREQLKLDRDAAQVLLALGDTTAAVALRRKELNEIVAASALRQKELNEPIEDGILTAEQAEKALELYANGLNGVTAAQESLETALADTRSITEVYAEDIKALHDQQALANIEEEKFNAILAARTVLYQDALAAQKKSEEREEFGETLEDAEKRIEQSLLSAEQLIDQKLAAERKIVEALVANQALSPEDATARLAAYRKELEETARETEGLTLSQSDLQSLLRAGANGWEAFGQVGLRVLEQLLLKQLDLNRAAGSGGGGFLNILGQGIAGAFGFSGSGASNAAAPSSAPLPDGAIVLHSGAASVGESAAPKRIIPEIHFQSAPRFHRGKSSVGSDEVPAILQRGERVFSRSDNRDLISAINSGPGGGAMSVNLTSRVTVIDRNNNKVDFEQRQGPNGETELLLKLDKQIKTGALTAIASPEGKKVMSRTYALKPVIGAR